MPEAENSCGKQRQPQVAGSENGGIEHRTSEVWNEQL
jgi:hypothetical protein